MNPTITQEMLYPEGARLSASSTDPDTGICLIVSGWKVFGRSIVHTTGTAARHTRRSRISGIGCLRLSGAAGRERLPVDLSIPATRDVIRAIVAGTATAIRETIAFGCEREIPIPAMAPRVNA